MEFYQSLAWILMALLVGMFIGGYLVHRLEHASRPRMPVMRQGLHEWARRDLVLPAPTAENTTVRLVTDYREDTVIEGRTLTFVIHDARLNLDRDVTFSARLVLRFLKL